MARPKACDASSVLGFAPRPQAQNATMSAPPTQEAADDRERKRLPARHPRLEQIGATQEALAPGPMPARLKIADQEAWPSTLLFVHDGPCLIERYGPTGRTREVQRANERGPTRSAHGGHAATE